MKRLAFSDDMMRAIAANQKSMTRRPEKRAVPPEAFRAIEGPAIVEISEGEVFTSVDPGWLKPRFSIGELVAATCAYIQNGNQTELHYRFANTVRVKEDELKPFKYAWKSSRIMPAALAPFVLRIAEVRAEQLGRIGEADAEREGITRREWMTERSHPGRKFPRSGWSWCWNRLGEASQFNTGVIEEDDICLGSARLAYANLWNHIHGHGAYERDSESWMWCLGFEIAERRIG